LTAPLAPDESWQDRGRCVGGAVDMFPGRDDIAGVRTAQAVCEGCVVRAQCLAFGMGERSGVWGGESENGRRKLRKARRLHRPAATRPPNRRDPTRPPPRRAPQRRPSAA
jgi:hypothetical protein